MTGRVPIAVFASGAGRNLAAILDAQATAGFPAHVAVVLSNRPDCPALARARRAGVPTGTLPEGADAPARDRAALAALSPHAPAWLCLAGYDRLVGRALLDAFPDRILNIHPSLLPAFRGRHAVRQALDAGVQVSGCTVHVVDAGVDTGPIVAQRTVPVLPDDDEDRLHARIQEEELVLYPQVIAAAAEHRLRIEGRRCLFATLPPSPPHRANPVEVRALPMGKAPTR